MSTLDSSSTDDEVNDAYDDNASYEEDASVSKAKAFITAVRLLLRRLVADSTRGVNSLRFDRATLQKELEAAQDYVVANDDSEGNAAVTVADFRNFRD